jgi:L-seryl-tRNA(Ser) seleniumtransferase
MNDINEQLRQLPQVEQILSDHLLVEYIDQLGHPVVLTIARDLLQEYRSRLLEGEKFNRNALLQDITRRCASKKLEKLQRVINGTGVIIHTNLGRSPLGHRILEKLSNTLDGYCNLELHIPTMKRGKRGGFAEELLCHLTGAEDALIVNNNASSVFLILNQFGSGHEVIVSRGELIQIGGGFRIPDIMDQTGARIVEVGTTNITEIDDFKNAITPETSMIFSAHQSNFSMQGFTRMPTLSQLATLAGDSIMLARDLGSGNLVNDRRLPRPFEVTVTQELREGPDIVCFSGDKLLGGCQCGIIVGKKDTINRLRKNPLMRMLRVDKITYYLVQETLLEYANGTVDNVPLWENIFQDEKTIRQRVQRLLRQVSGHPVRPLLSKVSLESTYGGGSLPARTLPSSGLAIEQLETSADIIYARLLQGNPPIAGYIENEKVILDFRTVFDGDLPYIRKALEGLIADSTT